jgi:hypothetical protein
MVTNVWNNIRNLSADAERWMVISNALDTLSEAYETKTGTHAKAALTAEGVYLDAEDEDGEVVSLELLDSDEIIELSPQVYATLYEVGAIVQAKTGKQLSTRQEFWGLTIVTNIWKKLCHTVTGARRWIMMPRHST